MPHPMNICRTNHLIQAIPTTVATIGFLRDPEIVELHRSYTPHDDMVELVSLGMGSHPVDIQEPELHTPHFKKGQKIVKIVLVTLGSQDIRFKDPGSIIHSIPWKQYKKPEYQSSVQVYQKAPKPIKGKLRRKGGLLATPTTGFSRYNANHSMPDLPAGVALIPDNRRVLLHPEVVPREAAQDQLLDPNENVIPEEASHGAPQRGPGQAGISRPQEHPTGWGVWWCWLTDCGEANSYPIDYCTSCGQSRNVRVNRVVNRLKRKLEAANHKIREFDEAKGGN
jgi:hypothetical protein